MSSDGTLYLVVLTTKNETVWKNLESKYKGHHYLLTDTIAFLLAEGVSTASQIREDVGINRGIATGIVTQLRTHEYAGLIPITAIEWIKKAVS